MRKVDLAFSYPPALQFVLAPSPIERSPHRNCQATFKRASYDLDAYILPIPHRTRRDRRPDTDSRWLLPPFTSPNTSFIRPFFNYDNLPSAFTSVTPKTLKTSALAMQYRDRRPVPPAPNSGGTGKDTNPNLPSFVAGGSSSLVRRFGLSIYWLPVNSGGGSLSY